MHQKELQLLLSNMNDTNPFKRELSQMLNIPKSKTRVNQSVDKGVERSAKKVNPNELKKKIEEKFRVAHEMKTKENLKIKSN